MTAVTITMMDRTTKMIDRVPWTPVLRTTASMASTFLAVPKLSLPWASASLNELCWAQ